MNLTEIRRQSLGADGKILDAKGKAAAFRAEYKQRARSLMEIAEANGKLRDRAYLEQSIAAAIGAAVNEITHCCDEDVPVSLYCHICDNDE